MRWTEIVEDRENLTETYVNLSSYEEKKPFADQVMKLVNTAYASIGGNVAIQDADEIAKEPGLWKLVRRGGEIVFAALYKDKVGRKFAAIGHNGSLAAIRELRRIFAEDIKLFRAWSEVSGATAKMCLTAGLPAIPNTQVAAILGKEILSLGDDGYTYSREIGGHPHVKVLVGYPDGQNIGNVLNKDMVGRVLLKTAL
jgi:hypothetical protein